MARVGVTPRSIRVGKIYLDPVDGFCFVLLFRLQDELFENRVVAGDDTKVPIWQYEGFQSIRPPMNNRLNCHVSGTAYLMDNIS